MRFLKNNDLKIPKKLVEQRRLDSRFEKGNVPFNKGKKQTSFMSADAIKRTKKTRFKKGCKPHNKKENGTVVKRKHINRKPYKWIKMKNNIWMLYHRFIWEKANGKIPKNHLIVFKDKNTNNTIIENLELITLAENMYRNSKHKYPKELIPSILLNKKLETKLKNLQNG